MTFPDPCKNSHAAAVDELFRQYAARLRGTAARITGSACEAEDIVQDAFMRLHGAGEASECGRAAWLRTTVIRLSLMRLRTWRRRRDNAELGNWTYAATPVPPVDIVNAMALDRAIASLPKKVRVVFVLHHVEGFSHPEIAELLAISVAASAKRLSRAVQVLRKRLEG